jgi:hypothetical protein
MVSDPVVHEGDHGKCEDTQSRADLGIPGGQ